MFNPLSLSLPFSVRAKRPAAEPNSGFAQQLMLFHQMHWCIDAQHQLYKSFRLRLAAIKIQKCNYSPPLLPNTLA